VTQNKYEETEKPFKERITTMNKEDIKNLPVKKEIIYTLYLLAREGAEIDYFMKHYGFSKDEAGKIAHRITKETNELFSMIIGWQLENMKDLERWKKNGYR